MLPAYAGVISSVGLGFLMRTAYLLPLTLLFLGLALAALVFRAGRRRGYGPLALGAVAAALLLAGKFVLDSGASVLAGVVTLVGASLWNAWPVRPATSAPPAPTGTLYQIEGLKKEK
jgi:hypothetical protein